MHYIGKVDNRDTLEGHMEDGRSVFVQALDIFDTAPKGERDNPDYWAARCDTGEFANPEAEPLVWIEEKKGVRQYYAPTISREQATAAYSSAQQVAQPKRRKIPMREMQQLVEAYAIKQDAYDRRVPKEITDRLYNRFARIFDKLIDKYPELDLENSKGFLTELNNAAKAWWASRPFKGPGVDW